MIETSGDISRSQLESPREAYFDTRTAVPFWYCFTVWGMSRGIPSRGISGKIGCPTEDSHRE
jgi:hypothetical protein